MAFHEQHVGEGAQQAKSYLIFDDIADERAADAVAGFGQKLVTMMPSLKRAFLLDVGKIIVPFEFGDAGDPLRSRWQERKHAKGSDDDRACAGRMWRSDRIV